MAASRPTIIQGLSLQTAVYRQILGAITSLELAPEQRLVEARLAEQLGVSRLPVREAIRQLEREQLVVVRPRRGAVVAPLTTRDAEEVYALRIRLETLAAFLATENASGEQLRAMEEVLDLEGREIASGERESLYRRGASFHALIVAAGENRKLEVMLRTIGHHVARLRTLQARSASPDSVESAHQAHLEILKAIARRQPRRAERLMDEHIRVARDRIVPLLQLDASPEAGPTQLVQPVPALDVALLAEKRPIAPADGRVG